MRLHASIDDDPEQFKAMVQALQLYKAAFGNLDIPYDFVTPDKPPWPIKSRGEYLGRMEISNAKQMNIIRALELTPAVNRNIKDEDEDEQDAVLTELDDDDDEDETEETRSERKRFQEMMKKSVSRPFDEEEEDYPSSKYDDASERMEQDDELEEEMELEEEVEEEQTSAAAPIQSSENSKNTPIALPEDFNDTSEMSANDKRFRNVYIALAKYQQIYGNLYVPQPFVVPKSDEWPSDVWGLRLGARVNAIRSQGTFVNTSERRKQLLDELGFAWTPDRADLGRRPGRRPGSSDEEEEEQRPSAASTLETIFGGSVDFGPDYLQPGNDEETPQLEWDLEGAKVPDKMTRPKLPTLQESNAEYVEERTLGESLALAAARAVECGIIEPMGDRKRAAKAKREKNIPWFNDDFGDDFVFEDVVEALTTYKNIYGGFSNFTRECDYVVPTRPEAMGFLGEDDEMANLFRSDESAASSFSDGSNDADKDDFSNPSGDDRPNMSIAAEIRRLQKEVEQESQRKAPVVALEEDAGKWPEHLGGMSLGLIVRRIRDGSLEVKHLPERKTQLDAIGFDWGDPKYFLDIPFEKTVCACYAYYMIRGDLFVEEDFVMPGEDPWPEVLTGYELGKAVLRIRELQHSFEAYHPEKVSLLRNLDFLWFADTIALPLDPNEGEMTPEMILLGGLGHPDYAKLPTTEMPMGLPNKIFEDGPFHDINDDPKLWWREYHNWDYVKEYWYQLGRRDNAYALRKMGFEKMAEEHEAKYGPGLFTQIDSVMADVRERSLESRSLEERYDLLRTLNGFRREMIGCKDVCAQQRDEMLVDFETEMYKIIQENAPDESLQEELENSGFYEAVEETRKKQEAALKAAKKAEALAAAEAQAAAKQAEAERQITPEEETDESDMIEEEEIDLEDELGL